MAGISIPLITEFKDTGIKQALKEFRKLETAGERAQFAIKKAAVPAAAALGAVVAVIGSAVKAAIEDQAAQASLARQIKASTKATDAQIASVEEYISSLGQSVAVSDDQARPAFVATKDLTKAQDLLNIALDVSAATGSDLASTADALAKGFAGNMKPLAALSPELKLLIKEGASLDEVLTVLQTNFGGAAVAAGNTAAGGMKKLGIAFDETKESIGEAFLPIMLKLQPVVEKFAAWAEKNPELLAAVIAGMGILAVSILAVNAAMLLNPAVLITAGIVALGVAVVAAYKKFEGFRTVVRLVVNGILGYVETMVNGFIKGINIIIKGLNLVPGVSIKEIGNISLPRMGGEPGAAPGIYDSGLGMTQAPDLSSNNRGMGGMGGVNVIVNAGLVSTPAQVGQDIIAAIQKAQRASGQVFAPA